MKKILLTLATLFFIILFSSCTVDELPEPVNNNIQTEDIDDQDPPKTTIPPTKKT